MSPRPPIRLRLFAGPTLGRDQIAAELAGVDAEVVVSPPVRQGDLLRLLHDLPDVVAIVDGYFFQVPAVLHKEILLALQRGARVLGAASLGALRAAELDAFGMEGVGRIYRWYKDGTIDGDDEVAVSHASEEHGFRKLTEALVNVRHNLALARERRLVRAATASRVLTAARRLHFSRRTWDQVLAAARRDGAEPAQIARLQAFLGAEASDLKLADARLLLRTVKRRLLSPRPWPAPAAERIPDTKFFHLHKRHYVARAYGGYELVDSWVLALHKLLSGSFPAVLRQVRRRCLAVDEAIHRGLESAPDERLLKRFRRSRELEEERAYRGWLEARYLTPDELATALRERDLERRLLARYRHSHPECRGRRQLDRRVLRDVAARLGVAPEHLVSLSMVPGIPWEEPVVREIKLRGELRPALERARGIREHQEALDARIPHLAQALARDRLEGWIAGRWRIPRSLLRRVRERRGFLTDDELFEAARPAYLYAQLAGR